MAHHTTSRCFIPKDWEVRDVPRDIALAFVKTNHYAKGASPVMVYRHGLYYAPTGELYGVSLWMNPTRAAAESVDRDNWRGVISCSRFCLLPNAPLNTASWFLSASMRLIDRQRYPTLLTYADTREGHKGSIYKATNWLYVGESSMAGGDRGRWTRQDGSMVGRKCGDVTNGGGTYTKQQMIEMGYTYDATRFPKLKFIHKVKG